MSTKRTLHLSTPGSNHKGSNQGLTDTFKQSVSLMKPRQIFIDDFNHTIVAKDIVGIPDGVVGINLRQPIKDALKCMHGSVSLTQDVAVFEMAVSESIPSVVGLVSYISVKHSTTLIMRSSHP